MYYITLHIIYDMTYYNIHYIIYMTSMYTGESSGHNPCTGDYFSLSLLVFYELGTHQADISLHFQIYNKLYIEYIE